MNVKIYTIFLNGLQFKKKHIDTRMIVGNVHVNVKYIKYIKGIYVIIGSELYTPASIFYLKRSEGKRCKS